MAEKTGTDESIESEMSSITLKDHSGEKDCNKHIMLQRISLSDAFFKHQQLGEPDLTLEEKYKIAEEILTRNKLVFLERFWKYLDVEDTICFNQYSDEYEVDFYMKQIQKSKSTNHDKNQTKNRRYKAMQKLTSEGEYFSEDEMKYRDPFLYDQLVGQYLTDDEINDKIDKSDLRFSTVLFKHIDILQENQLYQEQKDNEEGQMEEEETDEEDEETEMEDEDNNKANTIPDELKASLRQEFLTLMQERFISGEDSQFNYSEVDNNTEFDDLDILQKDEEEKYFDEDDDIEEPYNTDIELNVQDCDIKFKNKQMYGTFSDNTSIVENEEQFGENLQTCPEMESENCSNQT